MLALHKAFRPHHSCICKDVYIQDGKMLLIPELWIDSDDIAALAEIECKGFAVASYCNQTIPAGTEWQIKTDGFFDFLKSNDLLSYTVFSDEEYLKDLPVFYDDWYSEIKIESMNLLGWTVNKFTEPALLYGDFPIRPILKDEEVIGYEILDNRKINKWGLINSYEDALEIAGKNSAEDLYNEIWRPLAVCVDEFTQKKLSRILNTPLRVR